MRNSLQNNKTWQRSTNSPRRVDLLATGEYSHQLTRQRRVGGELEASNPGCSRPFWHFSPKILIFKLSKSNLTKPTSQVISINIRALKTIIIWAKVLKFKGQARHGELCCSPREQQRGTRHGEWSLATGERSQNPHGFRPKLTKTSPISPIKPLIHQQCCPRG